jgi:hypothetical protein
MNMNFYELEYEEFSGKVLVKTTLSIPYSEIVAFRISEYPDGNVIYTPVTRPGQYEYRSLYGDKGKMHFEKWKTFKNNL